MIGCTVAPQHPMALRWSPMVLKTCGDHGDIPKGFGDHFWRASSAINRSEHAWRPNPGWNKIVQGDCVERMWRCPPGRSIWPSPIRPSTSVTSTTSIATRQEHATLSRLVAGLDRGRPPGAQATGHVLAGHRRRIRGRAETRQPGNRLPFSQLGHLVLHVRRELQKQVQPLARPLVLLRQRPPSNSPSGPTSWRTASLRPGSWSMPTLARTRRGRLPDDTWVLRPQDLADCFTPAEDTWYFPRVAGTFKERAGFHGCQMPEQLLGPHHPALLRRGRSGARSVQRQRHDVGRGQETGPALFGLRTFCGICQARPRPAGFDFCGRSTRRSRRADGQRPGDPGTGKKGREASPKASRPARRG